MESAYLFEQLTWPIVVSDKQLAGSDLRLKCDDRGRPVALLYRLEKNRQLGFLSRSMSGETLTPKSPEIRSALRPVVRSLYLNPSLREAGETAENDSRWPTILLREAGRSE